MNRKKTAWIFAIILMGSFMIPAVKAPTIQVSPIDSTDDAFITGIGAYFGDTPWLYLRDASQNLVLGTRFRNVVIPQGQKINNATLFVRSVYTYDPANNISVTITGDDSDNSLPFNDSSSFSRTYTGAYVVWNISDVYGDQWHNVSVTGIVQEIIDRVGWQSGNNLSLVFFTDAGTPRREFASVDANPAYTAYLDINYGIPPTPTEEQQIKDQVTDPIYNETETYDWEYNHTYRGIDVWIVTEIGQYLNFSTFSLLGADSGKITGLNDTFFQATNVYSDSDVYLRRNFTDYRDNTSTSMGVKFGIIWEAMPWAAGGPAYDYVNLWGVSTEHDSAEDWTSGYSYAERTWSDRAMGTAWSIDAGLKDSVTWSPQLLETALPFTLYYHIRLNMQGMTSNVTVWNDIEQTDLNVSYNNAFAPGPGDLKDTLIYEYMICQWSAASLNIGITAKFISQIETDLDELYFLVWPNGTIVDPDPLDDGVNPEDAIDDLLGGAQPEDPQTDAYGTALSKFRWKLLVLMVGMIMMVGAPIGGVYFNAGVATWIKILFVMFCGLGILWAIKFM